MNHGHHFCFCCAGNHLEGRPVHFFQYKRVIAHGIKGRCDAPEYRMAVMINGRRFSVHHTGCPHQSCPKVLSDALMTQANSQQRKPGMEVSDHVHHHAGS